MILAKNIIYSYVYLAELKLIISLLFLPSGEYQCVLPKLLTLAITAGSSQDIFNSLLSNWKSIQEAYDENFGNMCYV